MHATLAVANNTATQTEKWPCSTADADWCGFHVLVDCDPPALLVALSSLELLLLERLMALSAPSLASLSRHATSLSSMATSPLKKLTALISAVILGRPWPATSRPTACRPEGGGDSLVVQSVST
jgi:hypothetical protein